ncbi:hypothetical protein GGQ88_000357 [Novosphingobium hassiacum]|uniref:Uncharacterized protein n=1 Tax=Novosphingobium hassiacum TaxID=173676 RepID=A0A7W5ZVW1_9SPHN|nr:hypothetical protein [Novosphingobium hassiacum]MBB3859117.1 hypothetical protein [Novosphingobium hassiacum]
MDDLFINIIASFIWLLIGLAATNAWRRFQTRGQRQFWAPFLKGQGPISVVLTDKDGQYPRSPRKISITDVQAYSDVRSALESLGRIVELKARTQADIGQLRRDCFVSLGGPLANGITEQVLLQLGSRLPVTFDATAKCFSYGGAQFCTAYDQSQRVERDYGLVVRLQKLNPNDLTSKPTLVVFGLHGHGTQQAVHAIVANAEMGRKLKPYLSSDAFALLEFTFYDHKCTGSKVLHVDKLS